MEIKRKFLTGRKNSQGIGGASNKVARLSLKNKTLNTEACDLIVYNSYNSKNRRTDIITLCIKFFKKCVVHIRCGPGSSVGIATDYGLDGPGSNPGGDETFRPSRPALGPNPASCKMRTGYFPAGACC